MYSLIVKCDGLIDHCKTLWQTKIEQGYDGSQKGMSNGRQKRANSIIEMDSLAGQSDFWTPPPTTGISLIILSTSSHVAERRANFPISLNQAIVRTPHLSVQPRPLVRNIALSVIRLGRTCSTCNVSNESVVFNPEASHRLHSIETRCFVSEVFVCDCSTLSEQYCIHADSRSIHSVWQ